MPTEPTYYQIQNGVRVNAPKPKLLKLTDPKVLRAIAKEHGIELEEEQ